MPNPKHPPHEACPKCGDEAPEFHFVNVGLGDGQETEPMCSACWLRMAAERMGVEVPGQLRFEPQTYTDIKGQPHKFYFMAGLSTGLWIRAREWVGPDKCGYEFMVLDHPETDILKLHGRLVAKIRRSLAVRYLKEETFGGRYADMPKTYIDGSAINGRVEERQSPDNGDMEPAVVVDGREMSWEELGRALAPYSGFQFRIEMFDLSDDVDTDHDPERHRPDKLWWLERH